MKERILEFLKRENKSSVHFAEEIGVQPSGISHILSGRNRPSLDFILKMLEKYPFLSTEWLLFGKGLMYREQKMPTLFDELDESIQLNTRNNGKIDEKSQELTQKLNSEQPVEQTSSQDIKGQALKKIIWFYEDNSFDEFSPRKN